MKKTVLFALLNIFFLCCSAQEAFKGEFMSEEPRIVLRMNLYNNDIELKDLDYENSYGYMNGNLNGTWVILKVKSIDEKKAVVRMISDMGVDAQDVEFTINKEGKVEMKLLGEQNVKTIADRRYVKMPKVTTFVKN